MSDSEAQFDPLSEPADEEIDDRAEEDESDIGGHYSSSELDFTPWHEEPLPLGTGGLGHRRIVKKRDIMQGNPVNIIHEVSLEPESEIEGMEVFPLKEDNLLVGLRIECGCGRSHEVRFEYNNTE
jgi:hypothetical protein